jgi:GxxExxY protein
METDNKHMTDNELTYQIRGAIWDVYNALGPGLLESVYEEALCYELGQRGLKFERQKQVPIIYKGIILKTDLRLDLMVEDTIIIELKSVEELKPVFYKQTKTYLKLTNKHIGLLVNFGEYDMGEGIHRIVL